MIWPSLRGISHENIFVVENGYVIEADKNGVRTTERVPGGYVFVDGSGVGDVTVNDQGDERAPGYALARFAAGWGGRFGRQRLDAFVRIDNAFNRAHIGSVIVNEGNRRYYEPGAGRGIQVGARWTWEAPASP